jgi:hypothetical protein
MSAPAFSTALNAHRREELVTEAEIALVDAEATLAAHPDSPDAAAALRGAEEWLRQVYLVHGIPTGNRYAEPLATLHVLDVELKHLPAMPRRWRGAFETDLHRREADAWDALADCATAPE